MMAVRGGRSCGRGSPGCPGRCFRWRGAMSWRSASRPGLPSERCCAPCEDGGWRAAASPMRKPAARNWQGANWREPPGTDTRRRMDVITPAAALVAKDASTRSLLVRLWREHVRHHRGRLLAVLVLTLLMAGTTAIYPVVIDRAFSMFTQRDPRILYQI